jgi:hypothetical protein
MTRFAKALILATLAFGPTAVLADGYSGTITGKNGGTITYSGNCAKGESSVSCSRDSVATGPQGYTATRKLDREITQDGVKTNITTTGQFGRTISTTREWKR